MAYFFRLDHRARLLAVFSPKCASTTLRDWLQALDQHGGTRNSGQPAEHAQPQQLQPQTRTAAFFVNPERAHDHPDYFKVLFVRDPLRRLVSFYAHWVVRKPGYWSFADHERRFCLDQKSFRRFLYALEHLHRNRLRFQHHLESQLDQTTGIVFDRVVLVEQLRPGLLELNQQLGFDYLPRHQNRNPYDLGSAEPAADRSPQWLRENSVPETRWFFDEELLELATDLYAADIAFYRRHGGIPDAAEN